MAETSEEAPSSAKTSIINTNTASDTTPEEINMDNESVRIFCLNLRPFKVFEDSGYEEFEKNTEDYITPSKDQIIEEYNAARTEIMKTLESVHHVTISIEDWKWGEASDRNMLTLTAHFIHQANLVSQVLFTTEVKSWEDTTYNVKAITDGLNDWNIFQKVELIITNGGNNGKRLELLTKSMKKQHRFCKADVLNELIEIGLKHINFEELEKKCTERLIEKKKDKPFSWHDKYIVLKHINENKADDFTESEKKELGECFKILEPFEELNEQMSRKPYLALSSMYPLLCGVKIRLSQSATSTPQAKRLKSNLENSFPFGIGSHLALIATFMDPRFKKLFFKHRESERWHKKVVRDLEEFIIRSNFYGPVYFDMKNRSVEYINLFGYLIGHYNSMIMDTKASLQAPEMVSRYVEIPDIHFDKNPYEFWEDFNRVYKYNDLLKMAHMYLCIPATARPVETISSEFPCIKFVHNNVNFYERRKFLDYENVNNVLFLHSYYLRSLNK